MTASPPPPVAASQVQVGFGLAKYILRATFRNKAGYFFSFIFPLVFVLVFGMLGNGRTRVRLGVPTDHNRTNPVYAQVENATQAADSPLELVSDSRPALEDQLRRGKIAGILADGPGSPATVTLVTADRPSRDRELVESYLQGLVASMSLRAAGVTQPAFQLARSAVPGRAHRHIDFILPGQIGFSMLSLATFGIAYNLATLRRTLVLKRMFATAVRPLTFVVAQGLSRSLQAVIQAAVLILVGVVAFQFTLVNGWVTLLQMLGLSFLGILSFIGFGILMSNVAEDEHTLPVVLNLFNLPQVLLAGVFFSIDDLPAWIQVIGNNLPLSYLNNSLRKVALDGAGLLEVWPYLLGMFAWAAVAYVLAARTFKVE